LLRRRRARVIGTYLSKRNLYMRKLLKRFRKNEEGAALVEYGMLVGLIAVVCIVAVTTLGTEVSSVFSVIASDIAKV
jgi:pilus assembly protein Flp/PilA